MLGLTNSNDVKCTNPDILRCYTCPPSLFFLIFIKKMPFKNKTLLVSLRDMTTAGFVGCIFFELLKTRLSGEPNNCLAP